MTRDGVMSGAGRRRDRRVLPIGAALLVAGLLPACGVAGATAPAAPPAGSAGDVSGAVTVFAAASLTDTFTLLGEQFMASHPDVTVVLSFAGSSALATQITQGAPADVFAAASPATMQSVVDADGAAGEPVVLATNTLQIAVPPDNPGDVRGLVDLTDEDRTIALCAAEVPCGAAAEAVFAAAGLTPAPDTLEQDVRAALAKVELGEVDAALVYRTDVIASGGAVTGIDVPTASAAVNDYPITVLAGAPNPGAARAFVQHVLSEDGRQVLTDAGFGAP